MRIDFYTGPNCSLCDDALELIEQLEHPYLQMVKKNIREDTQLYHLYSVRIPVMKIVSPENHPHYQQELGWPFTLDQLKDFLA